MNRTSRFLVILLCLAVGSAVQSCTTESRSQSPSRPTSSVSSSDGSMVQVSNTSASFVAKRTAAVLVSDDFAELDDPKDSVMSGNDRIIASTLESARQQYIRALGFIEQADTASAARSFEKAIGILNRIVSFPDIEENTEFTDLVQSIIEDYESYIQTIDALDENTSMFILRDKIFQAIESTPALLDKTPVERTAPAPIVPLSLNNAVPSASSKSITSVPQASATTSTIASSVNSLTNSSSRLSLSPSGTISSDKQSGQSLRTDNKLPTSSAGNAGSAMSIVNNDKKEDVISGVKVTSSLKLNHVESSLTAVTGMDNKDVVIDFATNEYVDKALEFLTQNRGRDFFRKCLERAGKWFPMMRQIAREEGVPEELIYHTIIESGLNPNAVSRTAAVGFWQFMKPTASDYNLAVNFWLDERRDPEKSTRAGMRYMRMLYNELGDWHLAIAAYNCGLGRVRRAIQKHGKENPTYWDIRALLPRETRNHVPLYIAAGKISMDPETFGFSGLTFEEAFRYDTFVVHESVDLRALAQCANVAPEDLQFLNPELVQSTTPPTADEYVVKIPYGSSKIVAENFAQLPDEVKHSWAVHTVRGTESLKSIAKKYGVAQQAILSANDLNGKKKRITQGMQLRIPLTQVIQDRSLTTTAKAERDTKADMNTNETAGTLPAENTSIASNTSVPPTPTDTVRSVSGVNRTASTDNKGSLSKEKESLPPRKDMSLPDSTHTSSRSSSGAPNGASTGNRESSVAVLADNTRRTSPSALSATTSSDSKALIRPEFITSTAPAGKVITHRVRKGETLYNIASRYGVRIADVRNWNNLSYEDDNVREGMSLTIRVSSNGSTLASSRLPAPSLNADISELTRPERTSDIEEDVVPTRVNLSKTKLPTIVQHKVRKGETLAQIADEYGVSVGIIRKASNLKKRAKVAPGQVLRIPTLSIPQALPERTTAQATSKDREKNTADQSRNNTQQESAKLNDTPNKKTDEPVVSSKINGEHRVQTERQNTAYLLHTVKKGENPFRIAQRYGVRVDDIQRWNTATMKSDRLNVGDQIKIYTEPTAKGGPTIQKNMADDETDTVPQTYTIQSGDTIFSIAKRFGISVESLKKMNPRLSENRIREGQTLRLQ
jgi:membrane-bound lytic murein transglycosylase D